MAMPSFRRSLLNLCVLALMSYLAGCASSSAGSNAASQAGAASGPIGEMMQAIGLGKKNASNASQPAEVLIPLRIYTAKNLNAGNGTKPLALVVKIYHLRALDRFNQMPFDDFLDNSKEQADLGGDLIDSREMLLLPDQRYISVEHMPGDTRYLGFVAQFRDPAARRWRFVYDANKSVASGITLGVHACAMSSTEGALLTELPDDPASLASVHCSASAE